LNMGPWHFELPVYTWEAAVRVWLVNKTKK
jgi:hypothetical protein